MYAACAFAPSVHCARAGLADDQPPLRRACAHKYTNGHSIVKRNLTLSNFISFSLSKVPRIKTTVAKAPGIKTKHSGNKNTNEAWKVIRELFYDFFGKAVPNAGHQVLAKWENEGLIKSVITQNIDNLHQEAGSKTVYEFHGTASTILCLSCGAKYPSGQVEMQVLPPKCPKCDGILKPDFIFFGEGIPEEANIKSFEEADKCDVFIIVGTTGEVMPASMLPHTAKKNGAKIIEINPDASHFTHQLTDVHLKGKAGEVLPLLDKQLNI